MRVLVTAWLALLELWRGRLAFLPLVVAVLAGLVCMARVEVNGAAMAADTVIGSVAWGLATQVLPVVGELVAVLAGAGAIAGEVERGTVLLLATKLPRWALVLGKALGVYAFVLASFAVWTAVLVGVSLAHGAGQAGPLVVAGLLGALPALFAASLAVALSARATTQGAIAGTVVCFLIRGVAGMLLGLNALASHPIWQGLTRAVQVAMPTDRLGEVATLVALGRPLDAAQTGSLVAPIAWLALAMGLFATRDLAGRG